MAVPVHFREEEKKTINIKMARGQFGGYRLKTSITVQYSTVQYSTVQYSTVQYSTVRRIQTENFHNCTVQYSTVQYSTVQYS